MKSKCFKSKRKTGETTYRVYSNGKLEIIESWNYRVLKSGKKIKRHSKPRYVRCHKTSPKGYFRVNIGTSTQFLHRIVATHLVDNPLNKPFVNHKNGIKTDNRASNLEWVTDAENKLHAVKHKLYKQRDDLPGSKLNSYQASVAKHLYLSGLLDQKTIGYLYGIGQQTISKIVKDKKISVCF